jgi:serine/threonine protein kinase
MRETQAELFQQIRTGSWTFVEKDWANVSKEARELIEHLLVVDPDHRWTVDEALRCAWIQDPGSDATSRDLMSSIQSLRQRRSRLRQFGNPVFWENNESNPVDASLKIQEDVGEGSTEFSVRAGE